MEAPAMEAPVGVPDETLERLADDVDILEQSVEDNSKVPEGEREPSSHFPRGRPAMNDYATLFKSLPGGMTAHTSPDPMPLPDGMARSNRSRLMLLHYPSPHSAKWGGYVTETGDATDETTRMMARAVSTSLPDGQSLVFQQQFDWWGDLYDGAHPLKVGKARFKFSTHFYQKLSKEEKKLWWDSKVQVVKAVIIDEIVERGRKGADCFIAGKEPLAWWPKILAEALPMAIAEASQALARQDVTYDIRYASQEKGDLPPLKSMKAGKPAPSCGDMEVQHPCGALLAMSMDHRARVDALIRWVQGPILDDFTVNYFQSLTPQYGVGYSEAERRTLQADANARLGGYEGPSPLDQVLTKDQEEARTAALFKGMAVVRCGGQAKVEKHFQTDLSYISMKELSTLRSKVMAESGARVARKKLQKESKNPGKREHSLKRRKEAEERHSELFSKLTEDQLLEDIALGTGRKKRRFDQNDLVFLHNSLGGNKCVYTIKVLQEKVLKRFLLHKKQKQ